MVGAVGSVRDMPKDCRVARYDDVSPFFSISYLVRRSIDFVLGLFNLQSMFFTQAVLLLQCVVGAWQVLAQTQYNLDGPDVWGHNPKPTKAPDLRKRNDTANQIEPDVCGYSTDSASGSSLLHRMP